MLEVWAQLYQLTKDEKYLTLAKRYADAGLFRKLKEGKDSLTNCHANASIPFTHGAAKMYEITGDSDWLEVIKLFWKVAVTDRGMFSTTGMNAGEFWVPPHMQGHFLGSSDQEFCTVYNMVRTASYLLKYTGEAQYADYIERALYNGFLAQQNAQTGMPGLLPAPRRGKPQEVGNQDPRLLVLPWNNGPGADPLSGACVVH